MEEIVLHRMLKHKDRMYKILQDFPHSYFTKKGGDVNAGKFNAWKEWLSADHVIKTTGSFIFCQIIQDVEWEDLPDEREKTKN